MTARTWKRNRLVIEGEKHMYKASIIVAIEY
jgi:hypothetical protein